MSNPPDEIFRLLEECSKEQRRIIFDHLRSEFEIHPIESVLNTQAELILEAIARDKSGLTFRMLRGVIADAAFQTEVVDHLHQWENQTPLGDLEYDYRLVDELGALTVQVKLQRSKENRPMLANEGYRKFSADKFVVETQKTRGGTDPVTGEETRSYRFGQFDILAVSMWPSTGLWSDFMYTVGRWLRPDTKDEAKILKFQPVAKSPNSEWTDDFQTCVKWFRSGESKTVSM